MEPNNAGEDLWLWAEAPNETLEYDAYCTRNNFL